MSHASFTPSRIEIMTFLVTTIPYFGWLRTVCVLDMGEQVRDSRKPRMTRKTILFFIDLAGKQYTRLLPAAKPGGSFKSPAGDLWVVAEVRNSLRRNKT